MAQLTDEFRVCLPEQGPLHDYVYWAHRLTHAPPAIHLACVLPLISYELVRRGFTLPIYDTLTLWLGVIAPPASAKTHSLRQVREFSKDFYISLFGSEVAPDPWVSFEGSLQGNLAAISECPVTERGVIPGILYHTEASKVFASEEAPPTLCQLYDGDDIKRNYRYLQRAKAEGQVNAPITIRAPQLSSVFMTTQAALESVIQREMLEGGLFSRILWLRERLNPTELMPTPKTDAVGRSVLLQRWLEWARTLDGLRAGHGLQLEIALDSGAMAFLTQTLFDRLKESMTRDSMEASLALRAMPHATRVAACYAASRLNVVPGITAVGEPQTQIVIEQGDLMRAANFVLRSYGSALQLGGGQSVAKSTAKTKRELLYNAVVERGRVGLLRREAYGLFHNNIDKRELDDLIRQLADADLIMEATLPQKRGRPGTQLFDVRVWDEVQKALMEPTPIAPS